MRKYKRSKCITRRTFGRTAEGTDVFIYTMSNSCGMKAEITNYGGILVKLFVPDRKGYLDDIVLGYDDFNSYLKQAFYFGAIVGRHANRLENAEFELNDVKYQLCRNLGADHLHGGWTGFDKVLWSAEAVEESRGVRLELNYTSRDGEENYPGNLDVRVTYALTEDNALEIAYYAVTDRDTVVNLTNHSYFNLSGHEAGNILKHELFINADRFTAIDERCMPTGEIRDVDGTPMDFRTRKPVCAGLSCNYDQLIFGNGFDHNWVLNVSGKVPEKAAELYDPYSGRFMEVLTTKPGMQFFTPDFSRYPETGKGGAAYNTRCGLCFETQYFPNAMKHRHFPSPVLKAGSEYNHTTIFRFSVE